MSFDFSKVKSITIPEGNVKSIKDSNNVTLWKGGWEYTINIGDYVSTVRYKIGTGSWTTISVSTTIEVDSGLTLYIQALSYEQDTVQWNYTLYNGDISRTEADAGGSVTVYQTRALQQYTVSTSGSGYTSTGTGTFTYGASYTVTLTANSDYCFTSYDSGGSGSNSLTCDNVTRYRTITYTGTVVGNVTINATAEHYYKYTLNDDYTHTQGSLTFNANSQVINLNGEVDQNYYFTSSLYINITISSRKVYADYSSNDRIITSVSGIYTESVPLGSLWLGSGTGYNYITVNRTISSNASTVMTAVDSSAGKITNNSYCTAVVTNSSTNKSYSISSSYGTVITLYCENSTKNNNSISLSNKDTNNYNYLGEGSFSFGDDSSSPTTRTLSRSIRFYTLTVHNNSGYTITLGNGAIVGGYSNHTYGRAYTYGSSVSVSFSYAGVSGGTKSITMNGDQTIYANVSTSSGSRWVDSGSIYAKSKYTGQGARLYNDPYNQVGDLGDGRAVWCRDSSYNKVRVNWRDTVYEGEVPSQIPYNWDDGSWEYNDSFVLYTSSSNGKYIAFYLNVVDVEDYSEQNTYVGVADNNYRTASEGPDWTNDDLLGTFYLSVTYGKYESYTEYNCYWS